MHGQNGANRKTSNFEKKWCPKADSNHRHSDFQSLALPTELFGQQMGLSIPSNLKRRYRRGVYRLSTPKIALLLRWLRTLHHALILPQIDRPAGLGKQVVRGPYIPHLAIAEDRDLYSQHCRKAQISVTSVYHIPGNWRNASWPIPSPVQSD